MGAGSSLILKHSGYYEDLLEVVQTLLRSRYVLSMMHVNVEGVYCPSARKRPGESCSNGLQARFVTMTHRGAEIFLGRDDYVKEIHNTSAQYSSYYASCFGTCSAQRLAIYVNLYGYFLPHEANLIFHWHTPVGMLNNTLSALERHLAQTQRVVSLRQLPAALFPLLRYPPQPCAPTPMVALWLALLASQDAFLR